MSASPGHKKWPDHKVKEERSRLHIQVYFNGRKIADSKDVIKVIEDDHPDRYYIPREDVQMEALERSPKTSECPFKGTAHYYSIRAGEKKAEDAVWSYEIPYDEHAALKDRMSFYEDKVERLEIEEV